MNILLRMIGISLLWVGIAIIAQTWVDSLRGSILQLWGSWQFWVTIFVFFVAEQCLISSNKIKNGNRNNRTGI